MATKENKAAKGRTAFEAMTTPPSPDNPPESENAPQPGPSRLEER